MKIGWIGTGVMGNSMCGHLLEKGYSIFVHTRTKSRADNLINKGAVWCSNPKEVAGSCEIIFTIVGYPNDVASVILGENGILAVAKKGSIIIDMTTSSPALALDIYQQAFSKGIFSLDAPVSGGDVGAREASLAIMVGGDREIFQKMLPLFEILGKNISYIGKSGSGQHTKMCNQILIASTMIGVVESLLYAVKSGLNPDSVIDVIGKGAASSWSINNLGRRITKKDFDPGFYIKHFVKDMGIALEEANRMNISLPGLAIANQFYLSAMALGLENLGTQAIYKVFEKMNAL